jgi:hypothetical protein
VGVGVGVGGCSCGCACSDPTMHLTRTRALCRLDSVKGRSLRHDQFESEQDSISGGFQGLPRQTLHNTVDCATANCSPRGGVREQCTAATGGSSLGLGER